MAASPSGAINPFRESIHANPWTDPTSDVLNIGRAAFDLLLAQVEAVRRHHVSRSLLIFGESGCGKTHFIARTRVYLGDLSKHQWLDNVFVAVQMHTAPSRIWRHIRYRLVEDLLRSTSAGKSQMDGLLFRLLAAPGSRGLYLDRWKQQLVAAHSDGDRSMQPLAAGLFAIVNHLGRVGELPYLRGEIVDRLDGEESITPALRTALLHLLHRRHLGLTHAWLRGDSLPESDTRALFLSPPNDEDPEGESRDIVLSILRLIGNGIPVVFCFDQTEVLQSVPGEVSGFFAFGNAAAALHDLSANSVLVTFVQSIFVPVWKGALGSNFDRLSESVTELPGLSPAQAQQLIRARLADAPQAKAVHLKTEDFADLFAASGLATPRRIIARAAQLVDQKGEETVDEVIGSRWEVLRESAERESSPAKTDEILEHALPALLRLSKETVSIGKTHDGIQLEIAGPSGVRGISVCNQQNMNSLAARLRHLQSSSVAISRLVLVRDVRLPISKTAKKTVGYLEDLTSKGAHLVRASAEALAALDALRRLISAAQAGELAHSGTAIDPSTVEEWLSSRLPSVLSQLAADITSDAPETDTILREGLLELLGERFMLTLPQAADALKTSEATVAACAAANPAVFGYLAGPPPVLFHRVSEGAA